MDRPLDEVVRERQQSQRRNGDGNRNRGGGRRGVRKPERNDGPRNDSRGAWVHDRYDDNELDAPVSSRGGAGGQRQNGFGAGGRRDGGDRRDRDDNRGPSGGARLRVENIHYELGQEDLVSLFRRIAPVVSVNLKYDRAGRSEGIAYVTYEKESHALRAIEEFDRANAHGQPIFLTLLSPPGGSGRSLFERVEAPVRNPSPDRGSDGGGDYGRGGNGGGGGEGREGRVKPSGRGSKIDRYVPSDRGNGGAHGRDRPIVDRPPRRDGRRGDGRRREGGRGGEGGGEGGRRSAARPKKTVEELDDEMSNYWAGMGGDNAAAEGTGVGNGGGEDVNRGAVGGGIAEDDMMVE